MLCHDIKKTQICKTYSQMPYKVLHVHVLIKWLVDLRCLREPRNSASRTIEPTYTRGQVSVNKRNSVLSNYFDVSFEIYYVRLKYIDSIGQVVKLLILRPASIYCTFKPGHIGSLER